MDSDEQVHIEDRGGQDTAELGSSGEASKEFIKGMTEQSNKSQTKVNKEEEGDDDDDSKVLRLSAELDSTVDGTIPHVRLPTNAVNNRKRKTKEQLTVYNDDQQRDDNDGGPLLLPDTSIELCTLREIIQGYYNAMNNDGKRKKYDGDFYLFRKTLDSFLTLPYVDDIPSNESSEITIHGYQAAQNTLTTMWNHLRVNASTGGDDGNSISETGQIVVEAATGISHAGINVAGDYFDSRSKVDADKSVELKSISDIKQNLVNGNTNGKSHRQLEEEIRKYQVMLSETQQSLAGLIIRNEELSKDRDRLLAHKTEKTLSGVDESLKQELQQVRSMLSSSSDVRNSDNREIGVDEGRQNAPGTDNDLDSTSVDIDRMMKEIKQESQHLSDRQHRLFEELQIQKTHNDRVIMDKEATWEIEKKRMEQQINEQTERNERVLMERERFWESDRKRMQQQINDQMEQINELNPTIQRSRILLEQERLKIEELEEDLEAANKKHALIEGEFEDYQRTADNMRKALEKDIEEKERLVAATEEQLKEVHELGEIQAQQQMADQMKLTSLASYDDDSRFSRLVTVKIPSDLEASGGTEFYGEHVTELDWELKDSSGKFTGWLNLEGNPDSHGILRMEGGSVYDGEWKLGEWNGHGVYRTAEGDLFRGSWKDGKQNGRGVYVWADGCIYVGDYVDGYRHGKGIMTWPHGAKYEGEFHFDRRNGYGVYYYQDGRRYAGEYRDDRRHGVGVETDVDGTVLYRGRWVMGDFDPTTIIS